MLEESTHPRTPPKKTLIIGFAGYAGSGKDTSATLIGKLCKSSNEYTHINIAHADGLRALAWKINPLFQIIQYDKQTDKSAPVLRTYQKLIVEEGLKTLFSICTSIGIRINALKTSSLLLNLSKQLLFEQNTSDHTSQIPINQCTEFDELDDLAFNLHDRIFQLFFEGKFKNLDYENICLHWKEFDLIKRIGYETSKRIYPEIREYLVKIGNDGRIETIPDIWIQTAKRKMENSIENVVTNSDCRYINEVHSILSGGNHCHVVYLHVPGLNPANDKEEESIKEMLQYYAPNGVSTHPRFHYITNVIEQDDSEGSILLQNIKIELKGTILDDLNLFLNEITIETLIDECFKFIVKEYGERIKIDDCQTKEKTWRLVLSELTIKKVQIPVLTKLLNFTTTKQ